MTLSSAERPGMPGTPGYCDDPASISECARAYGLTGEELATAQARLGRAPNMVECAILGAMWSEHCSYKSSRNLLGRLPCEGRHVHIGPGENAGAVSLGDGQVAVFKVESHNHPSFIAPFQGAATGVGGILRDVFTMGARPVALLNALRFGALDDKRTPFFVRGASEGIAHYGNCVGVPTVAGRVGFASFYGDNILVNAMCVGIADEKRLFRARASGVGNPLLYIGSPTGRDGVKGASMASAGFTENIAAEARPTVQVGDPFAGKRLLEACLALMKDDCVLAIQDMGAAGLSSSCLEMADRGGLGAELDLDRVPLRAKGMSAIEIMLSESQERMLINLREGTEKRASSIFHHYGLASVVIGHLTASHHLTLRHHGQEVCDLPVRLLTSEAPRYDRPRRKRRPAGPVSTRPGPVGFTRAGFTRAGFTRAGFTRAGFTATQAREALLSLLASPAFCSRRPITEQYDATVMGDTLYYGDRADAAIVRVHGTKKALALNLDCPHPLSGPGMSRPAGAAAVAKIWRELCAVGAEPLAFTNCLNFGSPETPETMEDFAETIEGLREAALALDFPTVSGNVSFYNETAGRSVPPTPMIGGVGLLADGERAVARAPRDDPGDLTWLLIGRPGQHLPQSAYCRMIERNHEGVVVALDLEWELRIGEWVRTLAQQGLLASCHAVGEGGIAICAAEMILAGNAPASLDTPDKIVAYPARNGESSYGDDACAWWFAEDPGRYLATSASPHEILARAQEGGLAAAIIGHTNHADDGSANAKGDPDDGPADNGPADNGPADNALTLGDAPAISMTELRLAHRGRLEALFP